MQIVVPIGVSQTLHILEECFTHCWLSEYHKNEKHKKAIILYIATSIVVILLVQLRHLLVTFFYRKFLLGETVIQ